MDLNNLLDQIPLGNVFTGACLFGALATLYIMQRMTQEDEASPLVSITVTNLRRFSLWCETLAMFWCVLYGFDRSWDPWPPVVMLMLALDFNLVMRIVSYHIHARDHSSVSHLHR